MTESNGLESVLEAFVTRVLDDRLKSFQQQFHEELQEQLSNALANFSVRDELREELSKALAGLPRAEAPVAAPAEVPPPAVAPVAAPALGTVNQAVSRVLQPTGQADVLAAFLQCTAEFAGRCALFVRRGDGFAFWRAEGLPSEAADGLRSVSVSASQPGIFKDACDNLRAVSVSRSSPSLLPPLQHAFGESLEDTLYLFPIVVQGRVVAALCADAGSVAGSLETSALEILSTVVGLSLETAAARAAVGGPAARPVPAAAPVQEPPAPPPAAPPPVAPAPALAVPAPVARTAVPAPVIPSPPDADSLPEEERDIHRKAYRSARVAVQDLLAYPQNKSKIEEGRKNKALYRLLKEDIDKTRETYQKRYGQTAARSFDYLHYELVTKLAANDPEKLGREYPGPAGGK